MNQCPKCKTGNAYIGMLSVECVNTACEHYSVKYVTELMVKNSPFSGNEPEKEDFTADERYWTELMFNSD